MKLTRFWLRYILFLVFLSKIYSQTAGDIIDKYITAIGGLDKINSIQSVKITSKTTRRGVDVPLIQYIQRPNKIRTEITMQGQTMIRAFDGTTGWSVSPFRGSKEPEKMNEEETKGMKLSSQFEGQLVSYQDKGSTVEYLGNDDYEGTDVYKIRLTNKDGDIFTYYIDSNTFLLLKEQGKRKIGEKEINIETVYGDYRSENGFIMPHSIELGRSGSQKITIDKVEFNIPLDDSLFSMPEGK